MGLFTKIIDIQNMARAWDKIKKNKPACGSDQVTWEDFDENLKINLINLHFELENEKYVPQIVKLIQLQKEEKVRQVSLFSMRDKVVQQSINEELRKIYTPYFSQATYAYLAGKSAIDAVELLNTFIIKNKPKYFLKGDISKFFDNIDESVLLNILKDKVKEEKVLRLIKTVLDVDSVDYNGELKSRELGVYQGSILAPILSNIYLMAFDHEMERNAVFYNRYSDDFVFFVNSEYEAREIELQVQKKLAALHLSLNKEKTKIGKIEDGFMYLGYNFNQFGKSIPKKAEKHLEETLEQVWFENEGMPLQYKLQKSLEIENGWEQYYKEERTPKSILKFAVSVYQFKRKGEENYSNLAVNRRRVNNYYPDIQSFLVDFWMLLGCKEMVLFEYENYYDWYEEENYLKVKEVPQIFDEIINTYNDNSKKESKDLLLELVQLYSDVGMYNSAEKISNYIDKMPDENQASIIPRKSDLEPEIINIKDINLFMNLFCGREDLYSEEVTYKGHRKFREVLQPFTLQEMRIHLSGERTFGTFIQRPNSTVHYLIFDIDISKKALLECENKPKFFSECMDEAGKVALDFLKILEKSGINGYLEDSGYRGYHIWIFFQEWISVRYVNILSDSILKLVNCGENINIDIIPNKTHLKPGKNGQVIKLPYGVHSHSGRRSKFLNNDFSLVEDIDDYLHNIVKYSLVEVKRIIGKISQLDLPERVQNDISISLEEYKSFPELVTVVLNNCSLMRFLYCKAKSTGYLTHGERLSILYVFGHLGDDGKEFVHTVMELTINYQYRVTQKYIERILEKPVSCTRLREQYKNITAEYGCSCTFKRSKNCYPSPVLHAVKLGNDQTTDVTVPVPRKMSKEKEKKVKDEVNLPTNVQALAVRYQSLKKQKRGLDKSIKQIENDLKKIYDDAEVDAMEIEMGIFCRRETEHGVEWFVEF